MTTLSISVAPASAFVDTRVCGFNGDPNYKGDLQDSLGTDGSNKVGYSATNGRHVTENCNYIHYGYWVRVTYNQWRWNAGTPSVCDIGSNGWVSSGSGFVHSYPANTSCYREGWTHSQVGAHGIATYGTWNDTGLYAASEA